MLKIIEKFLLWLCPFDGHKKVEKYCNEILENERGNKNV